MTTKTWPWPAAVLVLALLGGCGKVNRELAVAEPQAADARAVLAPHAPRAAGAAARQLSYSHQLQLELPAGRIRAANQGLMDSCAALPDQGCVVMSSNLDSGESEGAVLVMSVRREAVQGLRKQAESLGRVTHQSTQATDLGGPLVDTGRRLAMKKALRDSLLELRARSQSQIEPLLKVTEKLAEVQAEIEAAEGQLAGLQERLAMDQFQIQLLSSNSQRGQNPILLSLRSFGQDMAHAVAAVISFVAMSLPWLLLLLALPFGWRAARRLWRLGRAQKTQ